MEAFNNLDLLLRGFWLVAIPVTIIFLIQMVLTFIGSDASDGTSADFDGDFDGGDAPFQLFSFRNLMNFLLGFSWTGISFYKIIPNQTVLILLAVAVGGLFVYFFFILWFPLNFTLLSILCLIVMSSSIACATLSSFLDHR